MFNAIERSREVSAEVLPRVVGEDRIDRDVAFGEEVAGPFPEPAQVGPCSLGRISL
jgi:hypothetical protein